jgi:GTP cyclohydrolase I
VLAARPQVQERLGEQIADTIAAALDARGVLVVLDAHHECVTMRGDASRMPRPSRSPRAALAEPSARAEIMMLVTGTPA